MSDLNNTSHSRTEAFKKAATSYAELIGYICLFPFAMLMTWSDAQDDKIKPQEPEIKP